MVTPVGALVKPPPLDPVLVPVPVPVGVPGAGVVETGPDHVALVPRVVLDDISVLVCVVCAEEA